MRVCWLTGEEAVEEGANLEVVDRALMHGDIVTWASNPLGQVPRQSPLPVPTACCPLSADGSPFHAMRGRAAM